MALWQALQELLGAALVIFYDLVPSYGVAIILLTVAINALLFPLTLKQTRSMRAMQEIQPEVKKLQKQLKGDRERLNQELMQLYKERGVNPAAGCLPMILQLPIWFALFNVLRSPLSFIDEGSGLAAAIERNVRFLTMDLSLSPSTVFAQEGVIPTIPYLILIAIVVGSGYYQQKQVTAKTETQAQSPQQAQMQAVTKFMPILFGVFSWTFPTGLVLYFATSNVFRIAQQAFMFWLEDGRGVNGIAPAVQEQPEEPPPTQERKRPKKRKKKRK